MKAGAPTRTHDEYLSRLAPAQRKALQKLRSAIRAAAPGAEECISYQLAAFRHDGRMLVSYGATAAHCAFYVMSPSVMSALERDLAGCDTSKGTIRFQTNRPLPAALVKRLVRARLAENAALATMRPAKMSNGKRAAPPTRPASRSDPGAADYFRKFKHPFKNDIQLVRACMLGASPRICEGVKWNSLSYRTSDWFATLNWRCREQVQMVLHTGARKKDNTIGKMDISDPRGLIKWLADDRCLVSLGSGGALKGNLHALAKIVREWIRRL